MSLPVEKAAGNVDGVRLRHVVYDILIDKYLDESSCSALAISEVYDGFSSQYTTSRGRKGLFINHRSPWSQDHKEVVYPATAVSILKAILKGSIEKSVHETKLERLVLIDAGSIPSSKLSDWKHPPEFADFLVGFTAQMTHLSCCCLTFKQMDIKLMKAIKERVEEEVVTERPSLWFHLGRDIPNVSDPGVPPIHYHQMVKPLYFTTPPFYSV